MIVRFKDIHQKNCKKSKCDHDMIKKKLKEMKKNQKINKELKKSKIIEIKVKREKGNKSKKKKTWKKQMRRT